MWFGLKPTIATVYVDKVMKYVHLNFSDSSPLKAKFAHIIWNGR